MPRPTSRRLPLLLVTGATALVLGVGACADDGAGVRDGETGSSSGSTGSEGSSSN